MEEWLLAYVVSSPPPVAEVMSPGLGHVSPGRSVVMFKSWSGGTVLEWLLAYMDGIVVARVFCD